MKHSSLRRSLLLAGITLPLVSFALPAWANALPASVDKQLAELERNANGRLGVAMINTGNGTKILYRAAQRFPFCSTFKFMLAAAVLDQSQSQPNLLNKHINYHESDLLSYAPITRKNLAHGMTVSELCAATIQYSDNTAANLLIKELGGLAAVNQFARSIGDQMFRLDRWEPDLNTARPNDPRDTTTPAAMAASMNKLVLGDALRPAQRSQLAVWLKGNTTGDATIRAGAPTDWIVGDKTGSGDYGTTNDIAVLWPTKGAPIVLVVYFRQREKDAKPRRDVLASVTKIILSQIS
ncbi:TPA: class A beta-lactamase BlaA [Yersinia enterocolitica]|nr:class A beta-lactamase BlaA [Yersinia enterocolitica]HDL7981144.1 class A beta-lactamase BlaA [Yersinia enterocolitica]HDL8636836.1 class A beta-lactamase BlaA [Yersinia enterocolitica]HDL8637432.1 class A beta-lactamase BlaA [Yersinia enterocolitica]HDL8648330.1 class A beta-lactamase BlaA [Yersinia enterocolitica]